MVARKATLVLMMLFVLFMNIFLFTDRNDYVIWYLGAALPAGIQHIVPDIAAQPFVDGDDFRAPGLQLIRSHGDGFDVAVRQRHLNSNLAGI